MKQLEDKKDPNAEIARKRHRIGIFRLRERSPDPVDLLALGGS